MPQNAKNVGTASKIEKLFLKNLNQPFTIQEIFKACKFGKTNSGVSHKLVAMIKKGKIVKDSSVYPATYTGIPLHMIDGNKLNGKPKANGKLKGQAAIDFSLRQQLTPQGYKNNESLFAAKTTTALDIPGMMQHIINVDEQNKVYRNALENIALILEQAGVIETTE